MEKEYGEVKLVDYVKVINKRKRIILSVMAGSIVITLTACFVLPKVYKIDTTIQVGKIENITARTKEERVALVENPASVKEKIDSDVYGIQIRKKLSISEEDYPVISTDNPKDTDLVNIETKSDKVQLVKDVLKEITSMIISEHEGKINIQKELINNNIKANEAKIDILGGEIERVGNKIKLAEEERTTLESKVDVLQRTVPYQQDPGTQFALFDAKEKLANKKQEIENYYRSINSTKESIENLSTEINQYKTSLGNIKSSTAIKDITVSEKQISPRPVLYSAITVILGLFLGLFVAFGQEWYDNNKKNI